MKKFTSTTYNNIDMKIAINGSFLFRMGGGIKEYIINLINFLLFNNNSKFNFILYVPKDIDEDTLNQISKSDYLTFKRTPYKSSQRIKRSLTERAFWLKEEKIEKFDLFHSPFFHSPKLKSAKILLTIHDLRFARYPETYETMRYLFLKYKVKKSVRNADSIITISNFTKTELINKYNISHDKINVIHNGLNREMFSEKSISDEFIPPSILHDKKFLLYVSHIEPRKNHLNLIKAFSLLTKDKYYDDFLLVLVGKKSQGSKKVISEIEKHDNIIYLNFVEYELLYWLYSNAELFVFPSIYEGFGFPPIEAASFNLVSAVSNKSSIPEVCGESSFYFNPLDIEDIRSTLDYVLKNDQEKEAKRKKLKDNLKRFSWNENSINVLKIYNKLLS